MKKQIQCKEIGKDLNQFELEVISGGAFVDPNLPVPQPCPRPGTPYEAPVFEKPSYSIPRYIDV